VIVRSGSADVLTSLPEVARRVLGDAFRQHGPLTEALLLPTTLELRMRRFDWSFDELDKLTTEIVAVGEALLVDRH
jgi:hypothetical protein